GTLQPAVLAQRGVALAQVDQACDEIDERVVRRRPVEPRQRVVLRVPVVVAALRAPELIAHCEHRRAARYEERGEKIADVALPSTDDEWIAGRTFDAVIPRVVLVASVAIVLAVRLVVLRRVADEIGEREAVMRGDEV